MITDRIRTLPNTNTARNSYRAIPDRGDNYVMSGGSFTPNWGSDKLYVSSADLLIADNATGEIHHVQMDARGEGDMLTLQASAAHDVYYVVDTSGAETTGELIATTGSAPSKTHLRIGTVDTGAETYDDTLNRSPVQSFGALVLEDTSPN